MMNDDDAPASILTFSEDIADAEQPELLPKGKYPAELRKANVDIGKNSGKKYIAENWYIDPSAYPADFDMTNAPDGMTLSYNRISAEDDKRSRFRLKQHMEQIGQSAKGREVDPATWEGTQAMVEIDHDSYEGVKREVIKRVIKKV